MNALLTLPRPLSIIARSSFIAFSSVGGLLLIGSSPAQEAIPPLPEIETTLPAPVIPPAPTTLKEEIPLPAELTPKVIVANKDEIAVSYTPLNINFDLPATLLPTQSQAIQINPKTPTATFTILSVLPHGAPITKDQILIKFDTRQIDKQILTTVKQQEIKQLELANKRLALKTLEETTPQKLEAAKRTFDNATQDHQHLLKVEIPQLIEEAEQELKQAEFTLEYTQEELSQLQKMYDADDLTEETEEIILTRLKREVAQTTFHLKLATTTFKKTTQVNLPRQEQESLEKLKTATTTWNNAQAALPRTLEKQRLQLAEAERQAELAAQDLADLQADRTLMEIKASQAGTLYHGEFKDGAWNLENTPSFLFPGGSLPAQSTFLTLIPEKPTLQLHLRLDQNHHHKILHAQSPLQAYATLPDGRTLPLTKDLHQLTPGLDGNYHLRFSPADSTALNSLAPGTKLPITFTTHFSDQAILIPTTSIKRQPDGTAYVNTKQADGKAQKQPVTTGPQQEDLTLITEGLETGQVIIK